MQPGPVAAQNIDPVQAAHWVISNIQWLGRQIVDAARFLGITMLITSVGQGVSNSIEVLERAEEKGWQGMIDASKQHHQTAQAAAEAAKSVASDTSVSCALQQGQASANAGGSAMRGLQLGLAAMGNQRGRTAQSPPPTAAAVKSVCGNVDYLNPKTYGQVPCH